MQLMWHLPWVFSRPVVSYSFQKSIFKTLHWLSHPCMWASVKLVTELSAWPKENKDQRSWPHSCLNCQCAKIHGDTKVRWVSFRHPIRLSSKCTLTSLVFFLCPQDSVYRFPIWIVSVTLTDCSSETPADAFLERWGAPFGCSTIVNTDGGSPFCN